jgi:vesicle transport protein SEC22
VGDPSPSLVLACCPLPPRGASPGLRAEKMPRMTMIAKLSKQGALDLCSDGLNAPDLQSQARDASKIFKQLASSSTEEYGTVESSPYSFHYVVADNICFMTITEKTFPKQMTFAFLDELKKEFMSLHGSTVQHETRPYAYMSFERFIKSTKVAFTDTDSRGNMAALGSELKDVRGIMSQNIQDVLQRGEKLNRAAEESHRLVQDSKLYRQSAK